MNAALTVVLTGGTVRVAVALLMGVMVPAVADQVLKRYPGFAVAVRATVVPGVLSLEPTGVKVPYTGVILVTDTVFETMTV
jgi:hypothetical protein